MPTPVAIKVSAELAATARAEAAQTDRSLTGQIEHWAKLGRALEAQLSVPIINALKSSEGQLDRLTDSSLRQQVRAAFATFHQRSAAEKRALIGLNQQTRFEPDPTREGYFIRITPDGHRTPGRMQGRTFVPEAG